MLDLLDTINFIKEVLRESDNPSVMRDMLRREYARLEIEFSRLEASLMEEAA